MEIIPWVLCLTKVLNAGLEISHRTRGGITVTEAFSQGTATRHNPGDTGRPAHTANSGQLRERPPATGPQEAQQTPSGYCFLLYSHPLFFRFFLLPVESQGTKSPGFHGRASSWLRLS